MSSLCWSVIFSQSSALFPKKTLPERTDPRQVKCHENVNNQPFFTCYTPSMDAVEKYFSLMQGSGPVQAAYPAAVATDLRAIPPALPQQSAATNAAGATTARDLGTMTANTVMSDCPVFRQMMDDHHTDHEILHVVHQTLNFIMSGNKSMYVPADEIQSVMSEMMRQAQNFKQERKLNPSAPIARLKAAIGPGSQFAHRYRRHFEQHHPDHPASFEPQGPSEPKSTIQGASSQHQGYANHELEHHFGFPLEHM